MNKIHINQIDELLKIYNAIRIPSNWDNHGGIQGKEQTEYDLYEEFLIQREDGTPVTLSYAELLKYGTK